MQNVVFAANHGVTTVERTEIEDVLDDLWVYYRELKADQQQPTSADKE
jgi:hypothetical protein